MNKILLLIATMTLMSCSSAQKKNNNDSTATTSQIEFNADSAYALINKQVEMGARVPGTAAHKACAMFLSSFLEQYCDSMIVQRGEVTTWNNTTLEISNIIGIINPDAERRLLLLAHWDCRPWADHDPNPTKRREPVPGANDGASGVGVLLQLARTFHETKPSVGIDIMLVDAEDWGNPGGGDDTWALGTQHWTKTPHRNPSQYLYGILLDMVGTHNAQFKKDYYSMTYAPDVVALVWQTARECGYSNYFLNVDGGGVTDDHVFINQAGIKCIDIIDQNTSGSDTGFFAQWHTTSDDMRVISTSTLQAVGQTVATLVYKY